MKISTLKTGSLAAEKLLRRLMVNLRSFVHRGLLMSHSRPLFLYFVFSTAKSNHVQDKDSNRGPPV